MKDSLLCKNNDRIKTTKSIYEPRLSEKMDTKPSYIGEHRVENIDKINTKIQQILSCLRETENKNVPAFENSYKNELKDSSKMTVDSKNYSYSRTRITQTSEAMRNTPDGRADIRGTTSIYQEEKKYEMSTPMTKGVESFELNSGRKDQSRTKSFINSIQK